MVSVDPGRLGLHPVTAKQGFETSIPALESRQVEALDVLSGLASRVRVSLDSKPGDMIFINNWGMLHARDPYIDPTDGPSRHLVRLWLRNSRLGWPVPEAMRLPWESAYGIDGDGHQTTRATRKYPHMPTLVYRAPKYTAGSAAFMLEDGDDVNADGTR